MYGVKLMLMRTIVTAVFADPPKILLFVADDIGLCHLSLFHFTKFEHAAAWLERKRNVANESTNRWVSILFMRIVT